MRCFVPWGFAMAMAVMSLAAASAEPKRAPDSWPGALAWKPSLVDWNPLTKPAFYFALVLAAAVGVLRFQMSAAAWRAEKARVRSGLLSAMGLRGNEREARRRILALVPAHDDHSGEKVWLAFLEDRILTISPDGRQAAIGLSDIRRFDLVEMGADFGIAIDAARSDAARGWRIRLDGISDMVKIVNVLKRHNLPAGHRKA